MKHFEDGQVQFEQTGSTGGCSIEVLHFLYGLPWDQFAANYIDALRPSWVRVIDWHGEEKTDSKLGRVIIHLDRDRKIESIEQEVVVGLLDGYDHGHALSCELKKRRAAL